MDANKKWLVMPQDKKRMLLNNVWCGKCLKAVTIVKYTIEDNELGLVLKGKCKSCGNNVARVIEV